MPREIEAIELRADEANSHHSLNHMQILSEAHLYRVMSEYARFFNRARPYQGIDQRIPEGLPEGNEAQAQGKTIAFPILKGLDHDYQRAA